jgi:hypothetical protein
LLRVDPERHFFTPPSKPGLGAAEWVNTIKRIRGIPYRQLFSIPHPYMKLYLIDYHLKCCIEGRDLKITTSGRK